MPFDATFLSKIWYLFKQPILFYLFYFLPVLIQEVEWQLVRLDCLEKQFISSSQQKRSRLRDLRQQQPPPPKNQSVSKKCSALLPASLTRLSQLIYETETASLRLHYMQMYHYGLRLTRLRRILIKSRIWALSPSVTANFSCFNKGWLGWAAEADWQS